MKYDLMTDEEKTAIGKDWAKRLQLRESFNEHGKRYSPKRYQTLDGNKTALGIFNYLVDLTNF